MSLPGTGETYGPRFLMECSSDIVIPCCGMSVESVNKLNRNADEPRTLA
jgi:hypothetical protein